MALDIYMYLTSMMYQVINYMYVPVLWRQNFIALCACTSLAQRLSWRGLWPVATRVRLILISICGHPSSAPAPPHTVTYTTGLLAVSYTGLTLLLSRHDFRTQATLGLIVSVSVSAHRCVPNSQNKCMILLRAEATSRKWDIAY